MMRSVSFVVMLAVLLVGCRTYGGHGTEEQTYEEMQQSVQRLEDELGPAQSDLRQLTAAADRDTALAPLVERYRDLVQTHESMIEAQQERIRALSSTSAYRTLSRTYGAFITDHQLLRRQYARTIRQVYGTVRDSAAPQPRAQDPSTYALTPVNYPESRGVRSITMAEALRPLAGTPGLQQPEAPEAP